MRFFPITRAAVATSAAALLLAACSGGGSQISTLPGAPRPAAAARVASASAAAALPASNIARTCPKARVYIANYLYSEILIYGTDWVKNPLPCGRITTGVLAPDGLWVSKSGTLYVPDYEADAIAEYKLNATTPSRTLETAALPWYVYVGADGTVYVSETFGNQIEVFAPGKKTVTRTISLPYPSGIGTDGHNNLYVVSEGSVGSRILKYTPGSSTGVDLGIELTNDNDVGLLVEKDGTLIAGDANIEIFPPGATTPTVSFPSNGAYEMALNSAGTRLYVAPYKTGIYEYDFPSGALLATITNGLGEPDGVAYWPGDSEDDK